MRPLSLPLRALRVTGLTYLSAVALVGVFQRSLIYRPPSPATAASLNAEAVKLGFRPWQSSDGTEIGLASPEPSVPRALALVCYGNASCAGYWTRDAHLMVARGVAVRLVEYPGYGTRPGDVGESPLVGAATAAAQEAAAEARSRGLPFFILGESLGSGVAAQVVARQPALTQLLALLTPFDRLSTAAASHYPWLPVTWLLRDQFDSVSALRAWTGSLVVGVSGADEVIPPAAGRRLYGSYSGPKALVELPANTHWTRPFLESDEFWQKLMAQLPAPAP